MNNALDIKNLTLGYKEPILENINLSCSNSKLVAIIGRNGKGKSTLLNTISGAIQPLQGAIIYEDKNLTKLLPVARAKIISMVTTHEPIVHNISAQEYIAFGRYPYTNWVGGESEQDKIKIKEAIEWCKIDSLKDKLYDQLSDGQRQRINLARAIAQDTPIILLDEPTSHLDLIQRLEILKLLKQLSQSQGKIILFSTHNVEHAIQLADEIWFVDEQVKCLTPDELVKNDQFLSLFSSEHIQFETNSKSFRFR